MRVTESCLTVALTRLRAGRDNAALTEDEILMEVFYLLRSREANDLKRAEVNEEIKGAGRAGTRREDHKRPSIQRVCRPLVERVLSMAALQENGRLIQFVTDAQTGRASQMLMKHRVGVKE